MSFGSRQVRIEMTLIAQSHKNQTGKMGLISIRKEIRRATHAILALLISETTDEHNAQKVHARTKIPSNAGF